MRVAVIGCGAAGLSAAWALGKSADVQVFEAEGRPGGHANTIDVPVSEGVIPVDTGFIVYNEHTYPNLIRLFDAIGGETHASDMSFAVSLGRGALEYAGSPAGLFAQRANLVSVQHWGLVRELLRFYRETPRRLADGLDADMTLAELLRSAGHSDHFATAHVLPMAGAIWSAPTAEIMRFPARTFARFFVNHGLFNLASRPKWRTVTGGSRAYVRRLIEAIGTQRVHLGAPVVQIRRTPVGVSVATAGAGEQSFDQVVIATHADVARRLLGADAAHDEDAVLSAFRFSDNRAILHTDTRMMPRRKAAWASWNYLGETGPAADQSLYVTYWMNRLQGLPTKDNVFVTLNPAFEPAPDRVVDEVGYRHPIFDRAAIAAQQRLGDIQGRDGVWYCGAWTGYGFHEDAVQSGLTVAASLGSPAPWHDEIVPMSSAAQNAAPRADATVKAA